MKMRDKVGCVQGHSLKTNVYLKKMINYAASRRTVHRWWRCHLVVSPHVLIILVDLG